MIMNIEMNMKCIIFYPFSVTQYPVYISIDVKIDTHRVLFINFIRKIAIEWRDGWMNEKLIINTVWMEVHLSYKEGFLIVTKKMEFRYELWARMQGWWNWKLEMGMKWGNLIYSKQRSNVKV